jgi:hypothetical protein
MTAVDAALWGRFRAAGDRIAWRPTPGGAGPDDRIAHLHDEEARVVSEGAGGSETITVDPGPVGALVLLLALHGRTAPRRLETADRAPAPFRNGAFRVSWVSRPPLEGGRELPESELVGLARYALA